MRILANYNSKAVHCPTSNMKLGIGGTMSYPAMIDAGVDVRLGLMDPLVIIRLI